MKKDLYKILDAMELLHGIGIEIETLKVSKKTWGSIEKMDQFVPVKEFGGYKLNGFHGTIFNIRLIRGLD